jgi:hypothetical protein
VSETPPGVVTFTSIVPPVPARLVATICVDVILTISPATDPKSTAEASFEIGADNRHGRSAGCWTRSLA